MGFYIKQIIKMLAQHVLFPIYYFICCRKPVRKGLVVFADEHKTACPPSMQRPHDALRLAGGVGGRGLIFSICRQCPRRQVCAGCLHL